MIYEFHVKKGDESGLDRLTRILRYNSRPDHL